MLKQLNNKILGNISYCKIGLLFKNNYVFERVKEKLNCHKSDIYFDSVDQELGKYVVFFVNKKYYNEINKEIKIVA